MSDSVHRNLGRRLPSLALLGVGLLLQGCLNYREQAELRNDGTGKARIALGIPTSSDDPDKAAEVTGTAKHLRGIRWIEKIDSSRGGRRWRGAAVEFDSVEVLRRLNEVLPVQNLFGSARTTDSADVRIFTRTMTIPSASSEDSREVFEVEWTFPGVVLSTDRHARWDSASNLVSWRLVADPAEERTYLLSVRWKIPLLRQESARTPLEKKILPWVLGVAGANLLFALLAVFLALRAKRRARRAGMAGMPQTAPTPPTSPTHRRR